MSGSKSLIKHTKKKYMWIKKYKSYKIHHVNTLTYIYFQHEYYISLIKLFKTN